MRRQRFPFQNMSNLTFERMWGWWHRIFLVLSCLVFAVYCIRTLEGVDVRYEARQMSDGLRPDFTWIPSDVWALTLPFQEWHYARYLIVPLGAFLLIFIGSALYVVDIYHLPTYRQAFRFVTACLFAMFYPVARVEGGRINEEDPNDENNLEDKHLLRAIGGPGFVQIQPGNAVAFRDWRQTRGVQSNQLYFMQRFEMIARVVNLEDQHGHIDDSPAITRDGIRIRLKNIDYRFSVLRPERERELSPDDRTRTWVQVAPRGQNAPHPFAEAAINAIAYSFAVSDRGLETWHETVERAVNGALGNFIGSHDLDDLTAPRQNGQNPRRELRVELFSPAVNNALRRAGAELQWMDIGYFDIDDLQEDREQHPVDHVRTKFWATRLVGDADTIRSYGQAKRVMYQELSRAEAQAEMIISITDSLRDVSFGPDRAETLRQIFLARTAQILEALQNGKKGKDAS